MPTPVDIMAARSSWFRGLTYNSTAGLSSSSSSGMPSGFSLAVTATEPATVDSAGGAGNFIVVKPKQSKIVLAPFGLGGADKTFTFAVVGWSQVKTPNQSLTAVWKPTWLFKGLATTCTATGISGGAQGATEYDCDTIEQSGPSGLGTDDYVIVTPGADLPAWIVVNHYGHELVAVYFDLESATGANAFYRFV